MTPDLPFTAAVFWQCSSFVGATALVFWWRGCDALWIAGLVALVVVGTPVVMTLLESRWF